MPWRHTVIQRILNISMEAYNSLIRLFGIVCRQKYIKKSSDTLSSFKYNCLKWMKMSEIALLYYYYTKAKLYSFCFTYTYMHCSKCLTFIVLLCAYF